MTANVAHAQAADEKQATTAASVETIVVTARKREESLQSVPVTITALTAGTLEKSRIEGTADLGMLTPALNIGSQAQASIVFLRGVGSADGGPGQENAVAMYVDGVYQASPYASWMSFNNIERVEVLKGPQGTLFGRNATGGLINVITKTPSQTTSVDTSLSYGNYDTVGSKLYATTGISSSVAADMALYYTSQGKGWGENVVTGADVYRFRELSGRGKVLFTPSEDLEVTLAVDHTDSFNSRGNAWGLMPGTVGFDGSASLPGYYDVNYTVNPRQNLRSTAESLNARYSFASMDLVSISAYRDSKIKWFYDNDYAPPLVSNAGMNAQIQKTFTQELQLLSTWDSPFQLIVGGFFMKDKAGIADPEGLTLRGSSVASPGVDGVNLIAYIRTKSYSAFAETNYQITDRTKLTAGVRYTRDERERRGRTDVVGTGDVVVASIPDTERDATFKEPTYRIILDQQLTDGVMAFASFSRGFKGGGFAAYNAANPPFKPETLDAYEVGLKADLLDNTARVNLAAFHYEYKNLQLVQQGVNTLFTVNVPSARMNGIELEGSMQVNSNLALNTGVAWLDSEYGRYANAPCYSPLPDGGNLLVESGCDATGKQLIRSPRWMYFAAANYGFDTGIGHFDSQLVFNHKSKFPWDPSGRLRQGSVDLLNGVLTWTPGRSGLSISVFGKNLLDEEYSVFGEQTALADFRSAGAPRTYGAELRYQF